MNEHGELQLADPKRRAAARAIDAVVTIVLALVAVMVAGFAAALVSLFMHGFSGGDEQTLYVWLILFSLLALIPVASYEVAATARRGQTFGKRCMGLRVVVWDEDIAAPAGAAESVDARRSIERWAVPHGSGLLAGVVAGVVAAPKIGAYGLLVGADTWLVVSAVIYLSALGDPHGRGWHDKAAGTVVVEAATQQPPPHRGDPTDETHDRDEPGPPTAVRRGVVSIMMCAVVVGGVLVGGAAFGAIEAVSSISGSGIDKYDEATRRLHRFGQSVGPDGDACWAEDRQSGGTVFCDLESIGGLHWDTGDVRVADSDTGLKRISGSNHIFVGSGYMCLLDEGGAPWCWEWSPDVQPRPARAPQDAVLYRIVGAEGFACGQTPDYVTVTCWTVGVDQQSYQQANHRFRDNPTWRTSTAGDDPPNFDAQQTETGRLERFDALTGEQLSWQVEVPRLLVTETTS